MDEFDFLVGPVNVAFVTVRKPPGGMGFLPRAAKKKPAKKPAKKPMRKGGKKKAC